jgi:OmcA/MtrC family decaheme c-type cytochrome
MIHKIHMGRFLPSVQDGGTYWLTEDVPIGDAGGDGMATMTTLVDHSGAWFPGEVQNCGMCHQGTQGSVWSSESPTRALCTSCHDRTSFVYPPPAGMTLHPGGAQKDDSACANLQCHGSSSRYGVVNVHATPSTDPGAPTLTLTINSVANTQPGQTPVLHFSVAENGLPYDALASPLPWLAATIAGPTTDYAQAEPLLYAIETGAPERGLALDGAIGSYAFTFPAPIPASATGSYAVGMEGYLRPSGTSVLYTAPYAALNPVAYFAVSDATPVPRRSVVDRGKCNSCHYDLLAHEGTRKSPEYCVLCHTPNEVDDQNAPRFEVPTTTAQSVNFKVMIHKIHRGSQLVQGYVVGGDPGPTTASPGGTPVDFGKVLFPGDQRACWACHASTSYLPPLAADLLPTVSQEVFTCTDPTSSPTSYCSNRVVDDAGTAMLAPLTAACTACHDAPSSITHAKLNTAPDGTEGCNGCHGDGEPFDVQTVHVLPP